MKKILTLLLATALLLSAFAACGNKEGASSSEAASSEITATPTPQPTEKPTPKPTEEPTPEPSQVPVSNGMVLSNDIYSFQLEMNGVVYQFPMTYAEFTSYGWVCKDDDTEGIRSNAYGGVTFEKDGYSVYAHVTNFDINELPMNECYIGGLKADNYKLPEGFEIKLPGGIVLNKSTNDEITEAYGTPSRENKLDSGSIYMDYDKASYQKISLSFYAAEAGEAPLALTTVDIKNFVEPEGFTAGEVSAEVPAIVGTYQAPAAIGAELSDWTVQYAGKLYQLPAPVSEFEADGWVIDTSASEMTVNGRGSGWVSMMKDNQKLRVITTNYSEGATAISNCFVTSVYSDQYDCKVEMEVAKGIKLGMTEADLIAAIGTAEYEKTDSNNYIYYEVTPTGSSMQDYEIMVDKNTGLVSKLEISCSPKYADYTAR